MRRSTCLASILLLAACATAPNDPPVPAIPMIRMVNAGPVVLEDVQVTFDRVPVRYGTLQPGAGSAYRMAEGAYRYAAITTRIAGRMVTAQPIDFVGETPLGPGYYSYRLTPDPAAGLRIELVPERPPR